MPESESHPYEFLIALPIDHPRLTSRMTYNAGFRCRQLIGVFTVGSTNPQSRLEDFRPDNPTEKSTRNLVELRNECQTVCDRIATRLLNRPDTGDQPAEEAIDSR
jgi:hypothetical protein